MSNRTAKEHKNKDKHHITVTYSSTNEKTLNEVIAALIIIHNDKNGTRAI